jgi:glycosyltransferase involved in cell wall biosynthesis
MAAGKISGIIQSHSRPEGLRRALLSLQMQTYRAFEVVISDDSNDSESIFSVVDDFVRAGLRIKFKHTGPCGAAESMREALMRTRCDFIKILHDDDWLTPRSLEIQLNALLGNADTNVVYGSALICYPHEDKVFYSFAEKATKIPSQQWINMYAKDGFGPVQSPVTALYRRHPKFRVMWDEFENPELREAARKTGAGTDVSLQVENAGSNACVILLPMVVCFLGTDMDSTTQTDKNIAKYYQRSGSVNTIAIRIGCGEMTVQDFF